MTEQLAPPPVAGTDTFDLHAIVPEHPLVPQAMLHLSYYRNIVTVHGGTIAWKA